MDSRAASEVLSFALVFGIVVSSVAIISVSGIGTLQDTRDAEQLENAKRAYDVLSDNMEDLHQRGAPSRATEISLEESQLYIGDNVTINVTVQTTGKTQTETRQVRPIIYQGNDDQELIYEGGAVFHTTRRGGRIQSGPPIVTRGDRVLVPIVQTRMPNVQSVGGTTVLVRANRESTAVPIRNDTTDTSDEIENVSINVTSPRSDLWREYLQSTSFDICEDGTDGDGDEFVTCSTGDEPDRVFVPVHAIDVEIEL